MSEKTYTFVCDFTANTFGKARIAVKAESEEQAKEMIKENFVSVEEWIEESHDSFNWENPELTGII